MDERTEINTVDADKLSVVVVTPYFPSVSETFIRGHVERLPGQMSLVYDWPPRTGESFVHPATRRLVHKILGRLKGEDPHAETTAAYISAFRRTGARAVLAEYGTTGVLLVRACHRLNIPLVVHFHGYDASEYAVLEEHAESYPLMFKEAAAIIAVSRAMEQKLLALGAPAEKVHYNPCGIDCSKFSGAEPENAPPTFLAVGRFVEKKAPQLTIKAFARVYRAEPQARLRMIGDGPLLDECRELVKELKIEDAVTFMGAQPPEVVEDEMRSARAFVQHSVEAANGDSEGTPLGVLEAGASGLAVVSTRHAGIPDVVIENETGLLVDERDVEAMGREMLRMAHEPQLAARMGRRARLRIKSEFSEERSFSRLWAIIESAVVERERESASLTVPANSLS
ncbi:MAG TPA: glycosyltransferase [Pyrinomonadaceae bacterium]